MSIGYDGKLYILAFDHRKSFYKKMFGIEGEPTPEQIATISDAKRLIFEGMVQAAKRRATPTAIGALFDEEFGGAINADAKEQGFKVAIAIEKSGQDEFDFEYGDAFGDHLLKLDPDFAKVLVRVNPDGDAKMNERQLDRLKLLSEWLKEDDRKLLFELLVPAQAEQLASVHGDRDRYDAELRPDLMRRAIEQVQDHGIEVDIWKIEGVESQVDCEMLAATARRDGREGVGCVLLGRAASDAKVDYWLRQAAPVDGFVGFAIGRSIWWDALRDFIVGSISRDAAAERIASNYLRFIDVYEGASEIASV
jgi:myo-inositol catabolism protein IolC